MGFLTLDIPKNFNEYQINELIERTGYLSESITNLKKKDNKIIVSYLENTESVSIISENYEKLIEIISSMKILPPKVIRDNTEKTKDYNNDNTNNSKVNFDIELLTNLNNLLYSIAEREGAIQKDYPIILEESNLNKNKYHLEFPQNIMFVGRVPHNYSDLEDVKKKKNINGFYHNKGQYLRPCICYSTYDELSDMVLDNNIIFTAMGKCFRNEVEWKINDFRKREFYMREIIFIGTKEFVLQTREKFINIVWDIFNDFKLVGRIETASDPFFFSDDYKKGTFQKIAETKYELVGIYGKESTSIASFNYCGDTLCKVYNIKNSKNEYLHSGCVAFGLDRWVALISRVYGNKKSHIENKILTKI